MGKDTVAMAKALWWRMGSQTISILNHESYKFWELFHAVTLLMRGLWFLNPWWNVFAHHPGTYSGMAEIASEVTWGMMFVMLAGLQFFGCVMHNPETHPIWQMRRFATFIGFLVWTAQFWAMVLVNASWGANSLIPTMALFSFWVFTRLTRDWKKAEATRMLIGS